MFNSNSIEIAGKFDDEAYNTARNVIVELEVDNSLPIKEIMDITAAGTGTIDKPINTRLHYRQLQGLARIGHLNNENGQGAIDNLRGAWGEAIALHDFRSFPGIVVYEPARQLAAVEQKIGNFLIPGYRGDLLKAFGSKTPDILSIQSSVEIPGGFLSPTLKNLVYPDNPSLVFDLPYPNKTLVTAVEVTTSNTRGSINAKSKNLASFTNPFPGSRDKVFVPILYMDRAVFNKLKDSREIVERMRSVGGYVMLSDNLRENSTNLTNQTVAMITKRVQALSNQTNRNIENDKSPKNSLRSSPVITTQPSFKPQESILSKTELPSNTNKLDPQKNFINRSEENRSQMGSIEGKSSSELSLAEKRAEAITTKLEKAGISQDSDEFKAAFMGVVKNLKNLEIDEKKDILNVKGFSSNIFESQQVQR